MSRARALTVVHQPLGNGNMSRKRISGRFELALHRKVVVSICCLFTRELSLIIHRHDFGE